MGRWGGITSGGAGGGASVYHSLSHHNKGGVLLLLPTYREGGGEATIDYQHLTNGMRRVFPPFFFALVKTVPGTNE